ncbi:MAG: RnfABCDGE type electron transport complex subunit D [Bacteroidia bacterium]|nr:RnfABCDGE type electron transport complex subunit D [Bacteroidia bacterium]
MPAEKHIQTDARFYQIAFQSAFLVFGTWVLGWQTEILRIAVVLTACLATQAVFVFMGKQQWHSLRSAFITGLGLSLLLRSTHIWVLVLAAVLAIGSKFIIRYNGKHIFNPANFGIAAVVLITGKAWISPGQWGSDVYYPISILIAGIIVLYKVQRTETGLVFLATLFLLEFGRRYVFLGWPFDLVIHRLSSGSLLVYALFMITDPMTTPNHRGARAIWAAVLAITTFILSWRFQIYEAPIWALLLITPFTPLFDAFFKAEKFNWFQYSTTHTKAI